MYSVLIKAVGVILILILTEFVLNMNLMASITKDSKERSPYFAACVTVFFGAQRRQLKKSVATADRRLAQRIADALEDAAQGRLNHDGARTFLESIPDLRARRASHCAFDDLLRKATNRGLTTNTVRGYITTWLETNRGTLAATTYAKYRTTAEQLFASLGSRADGEMAAVTQEDISRFRNDEAKRVSRATANHALKIVRVFFAAAERDGVITRNAARLVRKERDRKAERARRPFTLPELRRVLAKCDDEWRSLVVCGLYTGARLSDLAALTWQAVDLERKTVSFVTRKTERPVEIPMPPALAAHIESLPSSDDPKAPLHPRACGIIAKHGRSGMLSNQFAAILAEAGLMPARTHAAKEDGPGRSGKRTQSELSFHCLRHTAVSLLKNAGVSEAVAMDIAGHDSEAVSSRYTHIELETKRAALAKLPSMDAIERAR